jgi:N6-L-threonylcarbamoyladenine synthase
MPCFSVGQGFGKVLSGAYNSKYYEFSHQAGHVAAAVHSSGHTELIDKEFLAFHVSGGTTEMVLATPTEDGFSVEMLGESADLHAGQAIDRIGVMMGLRFPCGKELEVLAAQNTKKIPSSRISVTDGICHLSGLENLARRLWEETHDAPLVSAFALDFCGRTLKKMTEWFDTEHSDLPIVYGGGVMSNRYLQKVLSKRARTYFAEPQFSADNAAGCALLCMDSYNKQYK